MRPYHAAILLTVVAAAQPRAETFLHAGGGMVLSSTSRDTPGATRSVRRGIDAGIAFEQTLAGGRFSLLSGLTLAGRGEKIEQTIARSSVMEFSAEDVPMRYLQLPVLAQVNVRFGRFRASLFAGPEAGVFLRGESRIQRTIQTPGGAVAESDTVDFSKQAAMIDFGARVGAAVEVHAGRGAFFIRPGYYHGLTNFLDTKEAADDGRDPKGAHRAFDVRAGVCFLIRP